LALGCLVVWLLERLATTGKFLEILSCSLLISGQNPVKVFPCLLRKATKHHAGVAELADAYGSGPYGGNPVKVQVLSPAPFDITSRHPAAFLVLGMVGPFGDGGIF
jgi:hypothetical protein